MKCFHHDDADGLCAGYWVHKRFPHMTREDFIEIDYSYEDDWLAKFDKDEPIVIVDFSFEPDYMCRILEKTSRVIWIDHHISAINKYEKESMLNDIKGLRYNGIAGCILTWAYFFKMNDGREKFDPNMCKEAPWAAKYIADYDVWRFEFGDETRHFKLGLDTIDQKHPLDPIWEDLNSIEILRKLIENGIICEKYRDNMAAYAIDNAGFEFKFDDYTAFCLNNTTGNSDYFKSLEKEYDLLCLFNFDGKKWNYSLYSNNPNVDCVSLVQKYFGPESGGHKFAAGGNSDKFIF